MAIYDNNGTTNSEIGKLFDNDGTSNHQIGKVYDNNGTTNSLIYSAAYNIVPGITASQITRNNIGSHTVNSDGSVTLNCRSGSSNTRFYFNITIDLTQYSKMYIRISSISSINSDFRMLLLYEDDHSENYWEKGTKDDMGITDADAGGSMTVNIPDDLNGTGNAIFYFTCNYGASMTISEIYFE